jgi:hypothetical protein
MIVKLQDWRRFLTAGFLIGQLKPLPDSASHKSRLACLLDHRFGCEAGAWKKKYTVRKPQFSCHVIPQLPHPRARPRFPQRCPLFSQFESRAKIL